MAITWREVGVISDAAGLDDYDKESMKTIGGHRASKIKAWTWLDTVKEYLKEDITVQQMSDLGDKLADYVDSERAEAIAEQRAPVAVTPNYDPENPPSGGVSKPKAIKD